MTATKTDRGLVLECDKPPDAWPSCWRKFTSSARSTGTLRKEAALQGWVSVRRRRIEDFCPDHATQDELTP